MRFWAILYVLPYRAMACPYFYPVSRFDSGMWAIPPRMPLGDPYTGECRAAEGASFQPDEMQMRQVCNLGYARQRCGHFPETAAADAVRFHISEDRGELIRIQYVMERDCWPGEHGTLERPATPPASAGESILERQAAAFVESYLRRRG